MADVKIKQGNFTRIHNKILEAIMTAPFCNRETRIVFFVWRYVYGMQKKKNVFNITFIIEKTKIDKSNAIKVLKRLAKQKIIEIERVKRGRYIIKFNKHYDDWKFSKIRMNGTPKKNSSNMTKTKKKKKASDKTTLSSDKTRLSSDMTKPNKKKIKQKKGGKAMGRNNKKSDIKPPKITSKDNLLGVFSHVKRLWNLLNRWQKNNKQKLRFIAVKDINKKDKTTDSCIDRRIKQHTLKIVCMSILNYHKFLCLPKEKKKFWEGHSWNLQTYLKRGIDNVERFADWDTLKANFVEEAKEEVADRFKNIAVSKAMSILKTEQTTNIMQQILQGMNKETRREFKEAIKQKDDSYLKEIYNRAVQIIVKEQEARKKQ